MEKIKQGRIKYEISIIVPDDAPEIQQYSKELWLKILRYNIPETREVFFNGKYSRTNSTDSDYGYKSNNIVLKKSGVKKYQYCKAFPYFSFYLNYKEQEGVSDEYFPPRIELQDEYKEINGYKCRKATIETANTNYVIYFTDAFKINDPTGAVLQQEGINGFILQQDEIPIAKNIYYYLRYNVIIIDFETAIPESVFHIPEGFKHFHDIDEARKANREFMQEDTENEWKLHPLSEAQKNIFNGFWMLDNGKVKMVIQVEYAGSLPQWENRYRFTTKVFSEKNTTAEKIVVEEASLWKTFLLVEEPPNYRLYTYNVKDDTIELKGSDIFTFKRVNESDIDSFLQTDSR